MMMNLNDEYIIYILLNVYQMKSQHLKTIIEMTTKEGSRYQSSRYNRAVRISNSFNQLIHTHHQTDSHSSSN